MAMSLEYVTRLIILLVVAGVVIGIVISVEDITVLPNGNGPDPSDTQFVNVSISGKNAQAREIAKLVEGCYDEYWKNADRRCALPSVINIIGRT